MTARSFYFRGHDLEQGPEVMVFSAADLVSRAEEASLKDPSLRVDNAIDDACHELAAELLFMRDFVTEEASKPEYQVTPDDVDWQKLRSAVTPKTSCLGLAQIRELEAQRAEILAYIDACGVPHLYLTQAYQQALNAASPALFEAARIVARRGIR